jgi:hypothetical protein
MKIPTYDNLIAPNALPEVRQNINASADMFLGSNARGIDALGKGLVKVGDSAQFILADQAKSQAETNAREIDTEFARAIDGRLYHPEAGYVAKQGKDAVDGYQQATDDIEKMRQEALTKADGSYARNIVDRVTASRAESAFRTATIHAAGETRRWNIATSQSRAEVTLQLAANNFADATGFGHALSAAREEATTQGRLQGWDATTVQLQAQKYIDTAQKMRYEAWRLKDPAAAFKDFMANGDSISPLVRGHIGDSLIHHAAPALAAELNAAGGAGIVAPADGSTGPQPRGVRNNNPGNVMRGEDQWQGEITGNDPRYASFSTPEAGIRAMGKTLITYQDKHGLNTVEGIVSRWAPATENNTAAYIGTVAKALGVKSDQAIDLHDTNTLARITKAMIGVENGKQPYTDAQITAGLNAANGGALPPGSVSSRNPALPTGNALIDSLPEDWKAHVLTTARSQAAQEMSVAREHLKGRVQDAQAAYLTNGSAPYPPAEAEFVRAYGQAEGVARFRDFQGVAKLGQQIVQVRTLPAAALEELVKQEKPLPGDGFAERQRNYETLTKAVDQVHQMRQKDPVNFAIATGSYGIKPIENFNDAATVQRQLSMRAAAAPRIAADYGTAVSLLTEGERRALAVSIKAAPVEQQKTYLATMYQGIGDLGLFKQTMQAIAPDSPTVAIAGIYQAKGLRSNQGQDVADLILRGQQILTPNPKEDGKSHMGGKALIPMPEEKMLVSEWNNHTGGAFKGKEQAADLFSQTAKAIYAARSAEEGDYSGIINAKRWKSAIELATGGIGEHNGARIVLPYGVEIDTFRDRLKVRVDGLVKTAQPAAATAQDLRRLPLENVGDGRYLFRRGAGYVIDKNGRPLILDMGAGQ